MRIAVVGQPWDLIATSELLSPWDVQFTRLADADIQIVHDGKSPQAISNSRMKTIFIPSDLAARGRFSSESGQVRVETIFEKVLRTSHDLHDGAELSCLKDCDFLEVDMNENLVILLIDILTEYGTIVDNTLRAKPSILYRLLTGLPIPYGLAPMRMRHLLMRPKKEEKKLVLNEKLLLDALRFILVSAIESLLKKTLQKRTWNGKKFACLVTHDIDTREGLERARCLKRIEEKYDIPSAWYIPSKHYTLNPEILKKLANHGEIGAHDTKHDGKLVCLHGSDMIERVVDAKKTLSRYTQVPIEGFRAPLLQHSFGIIHALKQAGYTYDTSVPTWEAKHPTTMGPHGIGTVFPMTFDGIVEIPLTLPQDHQMIHVLGLRPDETIEVWVRQMKGIKKIGGICVFLVHPDYDLGNAENFPMYEGLLNSVKDDDECWIALPREMTNHVRV